MAQFRATIQGGRGEAARLGHKTTGIRADVNGWESGVRVSGFYSEEVGDVFEVIMTTGSSQDGRRAVVGHVKIEDGEPIFILPARAGLEADGDEGRIVVRLK